MGHRTVFRRRFVSAAIACCLLAVMGNGLSAQHFTAFEDYGWGYGIDLSVPAVADLDGDGVNDLLVGVRDGSVMLCRELPSGGFLRLMRHGIDITGISESAPCLTDLDGDGLLDLLVGENGGYIRHLEQETAGSTSFVLVTEEFLGIDIGACARPVVIDLDGNGRLDLLIGSSDRFVSRYEQDAPGALDFTERRHLVLPNVPDSYTHVALADLDADGRLELVLGTWKGTLQLFTQHASVVDSFLLVNETWCGVTNAKRGAPCFTDLDGDGRMDMLLGGYDGPVARYEQPAAGALDGWVEQSRNILNTWDFGTSCTGLVVDLDKDGKMDILRTQVSEQTRDEPQPILHFRQAAAGDLRLETVGVLEGVTAKRFDMLAAMDFENDGRLDLIVARADERVEHYRQAEGNPASFELVTDTFLPELTGSWTSLIPVFIDLDKNGKMDLLLANSDGYIHRFEQQQAGSAVFEKKKERFLTGMGYYPAPAFADLDGNGRLDMLVGGFNGKLKHYEQDAADPLVFANISSEFQEVHCGMNPVPQFVDIDLDGRLDIVLPDGEGGMSLYRDTGPNAVSPVPANGKDFRIVDISPNPATTAAMVRVDCRTSDSYTLRLVDVLGREVRHFGDGAPASPGTFTHSLDLTGLPAGMYHVMLRTARGQSTLPLLLVR